MDSNEKLKESVKSKIALSRFIEEDIKIKNKKTYIPKTIVAACFCIMLTSGFVFAENIENYFKKIFSNSSNAINAAVEKGYVTKTYMNFIEDNGIGIKVDNIILDELNLNISFCLESDKIGIKSFDFKDITIINEYGKKIYTSIFEYADKKEDVQIAQTSKWEIDNTIYESNKIVKNSLLLGLREEGNFNKFKFDIKSVDLILEDNSTITVNGNWDFEISINEDNNIVNNINYILFEENKHIKECTGILYTTGLKIDLKLYESLDPKEYILNNLDKVSDTGIFYFRYDSKNISPSDIHVNNIEKTEYTLIYDDIGLFNSNFEKIELYLEPFAEIITLTKEIK